LYKTKHVVLRKILKQGYSRHREPAVLRHYGKLVAAAAAAHKVDVILALTAMPVAEAVSDVPIAFWNDAPFAAMLNWYPTFSGMGQDTIAHGHAMERGAHRRSALAIYSSQWAADIAVNAYGADPQRVAVVAFGPNIPVLWDRNYVVGRIAARLHPPYRLVWLGVEWHRKGGDTAVAVAGEMHAAGLPVELVIAGTKPPDIVARLPYVNVRGFLSKADVGTLLDSATLLILPSRADLSPIVFSEANALGVPVISRPIGGIPEIVHHHRNGMLFGDDIAPATIAEEIGRLLGDRGAYTDLALNAYGEFQTRLNWDVAARRICDMLGALSPLSKAWA
jgi:glycosyltransferase involved in cell wall biosynthesis